MRVNIKLGKAQRIKPKESKSNPNNGLLFFLTILLLSIYNPNHPTRFMAK